MQAPQSFASLAGRLAAKAAEIRPAEGAQVSWANFMAMFWCAIFEMLIGLCEALDARAAADARAMAAPAARDGDAASVPAARSGRPAMAGAARALRLAPALDAQPAPSTRAAGLAGTAGPHPGMHGLVAAPAWAGPCWGMSRMVGALREKEVARPGFRHTYFVALS